MKRIVSLILIVAVLTGVCACGGNDRTAVQTQMPTAVPVGETTDGPSAVPTEAHAAETDPAETERPAQTGDPSDLPSFEPTFTAEPTTDPAPTDVPGPTPAPTPTPESTPTPEPTPEPTPSLVPTPSPTPDPNAKIRFSASQSLPIPSMDEDVPQGQPFCFGGVVSCDNPITSVKAVITSSSGSNYVKEVTFDASEGKRQVELVDRSFPKNGNQSLTYKTKFETLPAGNYTFKLYAEAVGCPEELLVSSPFRIVGGTWRKLISNNLRNNYAYALSFFGSRSEFMFSYKWASSSGRDITVESGWDSAHIARVTSPSGGKWYVHKKAVPYYEQAVHYLNTTYVRVHGTNGDSGVIKLSALISSFGGTVNHRFVSDRTFVSHHSFGTAIDLNASMDANVNSGSNRSLIRSEVGANLVYNGISEHNGISYFDFTYSGSHASRYKGVPTTVINYLLYELAFFRAGFSWGYYFEHTCDAMHFGLSEMSSNIHNTSKRSLRKVFSYN